MKAVGWVAVVTNLVAHGWALLVFLGAGKVIGNAVLVAESDIYLLIALDFVAMVFTLVLALRLLTWKSQQSRAANR